MTNRAKCVFVCVSVCASAWTIMSFISSLGACISAQMEQNGTGVPSAALIENPSLLPFIIIFFIIHNEKINIGEVQCYFNGLRSPQ